MPLSDDELLDFDLTRPGSFEAAPRTLLRRHGDLYRHQLHMARWLDGYRERRSAHMANGPMADEMSMADEMFEAGVQETLRDIAAHLRQGDFLPGGTLYED